MGPQTLRETERFVQEARAERARVREAIRLANEDLALAKADLLTAKEALALVRAKE